MCGHATEETAYVVILPSFVQKARKDNAVRAVEIPTHRTTRPGADPAPCAQRRSTVFFFLRAELSKQ